ncbi:unnamed protein product [Periconia digitata]|uniref:Nucleoprotein TPR/MLP1 domain-containing protein n=1 Tax=Periconia digitata TaxID=1303443 RepID=A0A9W4U7B5_9PLEO|nr:unnamed protein product [Periconia digitata]
MAAAAVDVGYIAASYAVPETTLHSLTSDPTVELVQSLLVQIEAKAREFDDLKSDKLRAEVELEAAVHSADARARTLKATADNAVKEADDLRQKIAQEETARQQIETQLQDLKSSATGSTSQLQTLESRVKTLEAQNRDTVALHEAKSAAHDRLAEELSAQHQKFVAIRKQVADLEEKNQSLETAATSVKFRESNFQQEIELLRKNNEWFETELKTRAADNTKFRKEKNTQIAELQRANADANQTIDSLRTKEASQGKRIEELEQRVEQTLSRVQQLQEEARQSQESFRAELDNARRLASLHQESANTVKKRLQEVQEQLNNQGDQAAEEVGRLQAEFESERNRATEYENKVAELESLLENQESQLAELRNSAQVPATPRRALNGNFDSPGRAGSPIAFSPGGSRLRGGLSMTQLYTENAKLKTEIRAWQEKDEKRARMMNEMLEELEDRQPELEELRQENERLTAAAQEVSSVLDEALKAKEKAQKEARKLQGDHQGLLRQRELDRQLIRDATFQSTFLLYRQRVQEEGVENLSPEEAKFFEETTNNEIPDHLLDEDETATSRILSKHLVLFKDVSQLMAQNQEALRAVREVAARYEGSEAQLKAAEQERNLEELKQLRDKLADYEGQIESLNLRSQSFMKERDMYRRIVTSRGQAPTSAMDESTGGRETPTAGFGDSVISIAGAPISDNSEIVKELQTRLDTVKEEYATDRATSKQQVDELVKENRQLQSDNVRLSTKQEMVQERYDLLQHKISSLESEKAELKKQHASLYDEFVKTDQRKQEDSENLIEVKSQLESVERENVNLKASQSLWKTIEARLNEDKNMLMEDKARLNKIIADMQTLRNEHDLAEAQNRRNLQSRIDGLEADLQNTQRKLEEEVEDHKKLVMRHEWEHTEKQRKIDDLMKAANEVRQELASVKSIRDQLQLRVTELQDELRIAHARVQASQPQQSASGSGDGNEEDLSAEDQLANQVTELQRKYERAQQELAAANTTADDLRAIAQDTEERSQEIHDAAEKLQHEFDENVAEISRLRKQVEEISEELTTAKTELSELRGGQSQEILQLTQKQQSLEAEIATLKENINDCQAEIESKTQDVSAQAEIAKRAQQDYENEFRKHGETMANLRTVRAERDTFSGEITQYKTQAEAASASLAQNEEHLASTQEQYKRELEEARTRYSQLEESNKTLYAQYDALTAQIASLKSEQMSVAASNADASSLDSNVSGLQALNKILRDDKDVLQLQMNAKELELQRFRQELTRKEEQLDRVNEKLIAEQSQNTNRQSGANHQALQDSIAQLNVYRESNTTLRNEKNRLETERDGFKQKVEALNHEIGPLKARVSELEGELEINSGHLKTLEEDRDRWQKRHQDVLLRYDRIDPKELEDLKKQLAQLQEERDQAQQQVDGVDARITAAKEEEKAVWEERRKNIVNQAREKARTDKQARDKITAERDQVIVERDQLKAELETVKSELATVQSDLETTRQSRDEAFEKMEAADTAMEEEGQVNEGNPDFTAAEKAELEARVAAAEDRANQQSNESVSLGIQLQGLGAREKDLENQVAELQQRIGVLNSEISESQRQKAQDDARLQEVQSGATPSEEQKPPQASEETSDLTEKLTIAQKEIEDLRTRAEMAESLASQNDNNAVDVIPGQTNQETGEQGGEQLASVQSTLEDREAAIAKAEAEITALKAEIDQVRQDSEKKVKTSAEKMDSLKTKANDKIKEKAVEIERLNKELKEKEKTIAGLQQEVEELKLQSQDKSNTIIAPVNPSPVPGSEASERETQDWINGNPTAQKIIKRTVIQRIKAEQDTKDGQGSEDATPIEQPTDSSVITKEEHEQIVAKKQEERQSLVETKFAAKLSLASGRSAKLKAQWDVVEKAATETPEKPVKEVYDVAKTAKPAPAAPVNVPASNQPLPPTQQPPSPVTAAINAATQQLPGQHAQANGARQNSFGPSSFGQSGNPFAQSVNQAFPNPMQNQMGQSFYGGGLPQPGFSAPTNQFMNPNRPNSPYNQQVQQQHIQQGGRGRPEVGTGPGALRSLGQPAQSGIPRGGGTGIPMPGGGRGQGRGQVSNAQGQASQIGRGGGQNRGRGGGRGGQQQAPSSPMNASAAAFQPGGGLGRGQKRGAEDDGGHRGGKRPRGGRGGAGGGAAGGSAGGEE